MLICIAIRGLLKLNKRKNEIFQLKQLGKGWPEFYISEVAECLHGHERQVNSLSIVFRFYEKHR